LNFGGEGVILILKAMEIVNIDGYGRVKLPSVLRERIEKYGKDVFITTLDMESIRIYPVSEWLRISYVAGESAHKNPAFRHCVIRLNRFGVESEIDDQGRIFIGKELRSKTGLAGRIEIQWKKSHLRLKKADNG
jgi:DNA-binding transcriptional regulator/RsmH inhibitor MraZ